MIRISTIFIAICMVLVAASLGLVLHAVAGFSGSESAIVALTALTFLILYNAVSMRLRDRSDVGGQIADLSRGTADLARQVAEFGRRLAAVEGRVVSANSAGADRIQAVVGEINELGALVKQLAVSVANHDDLLSSGAAAAAPAPASKPHSEPQNEPPFTPEVTPPAVARPTPVAAAAPAPAVAAEAISASRSQPQLLAAVKNAVEENRLDIYLQPMVTLPQRKVRFYEAVTRLRDDRDQVIAADDFISIAEAGGLMGKIDHMVMLRCVQVLRRLMVRNKEVGVFCNVSATTLGQLRAMPRCSRGQPRAGAILRARILAGGIPPSRPDRNRASRRAVAARLSLLDRSCHGSSGRTAGTRRPRCPLHQGAGGAAARSQAELDLRYPPLRSFRSARPLRHRSDRRKDRGRARRGRSARL